MTELAENLVLTPLTIDDLGWMFELFSDARGWKHFPAGRHETPAATEAFLGPVLRGWERDGLSYWAARLPDGTPVGMGGVRMLDGRWNLGFRIAVDHQGNGYASELASRALAAAHDLRPDVPVVAWVDEGNGPSLAVVGKLGMLDHGLQEVDGERLIAFADRRVGFGDDPAGGL